MFKSVAGITKHFEIGSIVIFAVSVLMMHKQSALTAAAFARMNRFLAAIIPFQPFLFRDPVRISFFDHSCAFEFMAAHVRARFSRLREKNAAYWARFFGASSFPSRIACPEALNSFATFANGWHRSNPALPSTINRAPIFQDRGRSFEWFATQFALNSDASTPDYVFHGLDCITDGIA